MWNNNKPKIPNRLATVEAQRRKYERIQKDFHSSIERKSKIHSYLRKSMEKNTIIYGESARGQTAAGIFASGK